MKVEYRKDMSHSYMLVSMKNEDSGDNYQLKTLFSNHIEGLLPLSFEHINNTLKCRYDITGLKSLAVFCESRPPEMQEVKAVFSGLLDLVSLLEDYLLDPSHLLISPDYLYIDLRTKKIHAAFMPESGISFREGLQKLAEYLITAGGITDRDTVFMLCTILESLKGDSLKCDEIRELLAGSPGAAEASGDAAEVEPLPEEDLVFQGNEFEKPGEACISADTASGGGDGKNSAPGKKQPGRYTVILALFMALAVAITWTALRLQDIYILETWEMAALSAAAACLILCCAAFANRIASAHGPEKGIPADSFAMPYPEEAYRGPQQKRPETKNSGGLPWNDLQGDTFWGGNEDVFAWTEEDPAGARADPCADRAGQTVFLGNMTPPGRKIPASLVPADKASGLPSFVLEERDLLFGQKESYVDRVIPDSTVSRIHAKISPKNGGYVISDMGSSNGTYVNGKAAAGREEIPLSDGFHIMFARCEYVFHEGRTVL